MANNKDLLDDLTQQLRQQEVPDFPRNQILDRIVAKRPTVEAKPENFWRRILIKPPLQLAATILVALFTVGLLSDIGPFSSNVSFGMEQVISAVEQAKSVSYTYTTYGWKGDPWPDPYIRKCWVQGGCSRVDTHGEIQIQNTLQGQYTRIIPKEKKAVICPLYPSPSGAMNSPTKFLQQLKSLSNGLEEKTYKQDDTGRSVVEFRRKFYGEDWAVTVDATTKLPLRMKIDRGKPMGKNIHEVMSDFVFEAPIDESFFEVVIPDGFTVEKWVADKTNTSYPEGDAETLIVSHGNLGPAQAGMTTDEIIQVLGQPDWIGDDAELMYYSRGFTLKVPSDGELMVSCFNQASMGTMVRDFVGRTEEGIKLGDTREEVIEVYGKPEINRHDHLHYVELGWMFNFKDNKIYRFSPERPMPRIDDQGVQTRILKDGGILQAAPGVDIDAMIDEEGNLIR